MKNKQNLFRRLLAVMMLVLVMAFSTQTTAKAGFGDFNDYDSSSDWDSSDSWDSGWDSDYDSYDYDYDDDGGSGEFSPIAIVIGLIIVVYSIILYIVWSLSIHNNIVATAFQNNLIRSSAIRRQVIKCCFPTCIISDCAVARSRANTNMRCTTPWLP